MNRPPTTKDAGAGLAPAQLAIAAGVATALAFLVVGPAFQLQTYGDGAIFSWAVALGEAWDIHWRNIAPRAAAYVLQLHPAERIGAWTQSPRAAVAAYGVLLAAPQALGLAATFVFDRTRARIFFATACASTACLAPLVFGFPSEMLLAHALFWPTLALASSAAATKRAAALVLLFMLALAFTHEAALGLLAGIVGLQWLRGWRHPAFLRAFACFVLALAAWLAVNRLFPPDAYYGEVRLRAAGEFLEARSLAFPEARLVAVALATYFALAFALRSFTPRAAWFAATATLAGLAIYWLKFDAIMHAENRYYARTILLGGTCAFALVAGLTFLRAEGRTGRIERLGAPALNAILCAAWAFPGALALLLVVHVVETTKFVRGFVDYRAAVRALAEGDAADSQLGAPFFVSSARIAPDLDRLSWFSTTPYFSALVADFAPKRLVVDPKGNYFWTDCATATRHAERDSPVPRRTREMIAAYACAHRR